MPPEPASSLFRRDRKKILRNTYKDSPGWKQFAEKICKPIEVKQALLEEQSGCCALCGNPIVFLGTDDCTVHHLSYDRACTFGGNAVENLSCGTCLSAAPNKAAACLVHLRLLHTLCHDELHKAERRDPVWRALVGLSSLENTLDERM